jgi:hypothetical protein
MCQTKSFVASWLSSSQTQRTEAQQAHKYKEHGGTQGHKGTGTQAYAQHLQPPPPKKKPLLRIQHTVYGISPLPPPKKNYSSKHRAEGEKAKSKFTSTKTYMHLVRSFAPHWLRCSSVILLEHSKVCCFCFAATVCWRGQSPVLAAALSHHAFDLPIRHRTFYLR